MYHHHTLIAIVVLDLTIPLTLKTNDTQYMIYLSTNLLYSTTPPIAPDRRTRIDGRLKRIGDTVVIVRSDNKGTIVHIKNDSIWVLPHNIILEPKVEILAATELLHGEGISSLNRAWLNGLGIYFFDPIELHNID